MELCSFMVHFTGGIKANNLLRTLHGAVSSTGHTLDGIAVVSEIVSSQNPENTAACLSKVLHSFRAQMSAIVPRGCVLASGLYDENGRPSKHFAILEGVQTLMTKIRETGPLVHQVCMVSSIEGYLNAHVCCRSPITLLLHNLPTSPSVWGQAQSWRPTHRKWRT